MKTIFITGTSSGLGKATAKLFASKGWNVIATMRNPENEQELSQLPNVTLLPLDVTNPEQIKSTTRTALALNDIDVVFNNAGYILAGPLEGITDDQFVRQVNTNFLGVVRVTQAFIPYFREKGNGLFITTSSYGAMVPGPFLSIYQATKRALEAWAESMYFELSKFGIGIKTLVPSHMKTNRITSSADIANHKAYTELMSKVWSVFLRPERNAAASYPDDIAKVVFEAATDGKDQLRYLAGEDVVRLYTHLQTVGDVQVRKETDQIYFGDSSAIKN